MITKMMDLRAWKDVKVKETLFQEAGKIRKSIPCGVEKSVLKFSERDGLVIEPVWQQMKGEYSRVLNTEENTTDDVLSAVDF